jgi:hypothetical protein
MESDRAQERQKPENETRPEATADLSRTAASFAESDRKTPVPGRDNLFQVLVYLGCQISVSKRSQAGHDTAVDKA